MSATLNDRLCALVGQNSLSIAIREGSGVDNPDLVSDIGQQLISVWGVSPLEAGFWADRTLRVALDWSCGDEGAFDSFWTEIGLAPSEERAQQFKDWFSGSVVAHGTGWPKIVQIPKDLSVDSFRFDNLIGPEPEDQSTPCYLSLKSPLNLTVGESVSSDKILAELIEGSALPAASKKELSAITEAIAGTPDPAPLQAFLNTRIAKILSENGYDGLRVTQLSGRQSFVVLEQAQVKTLESSSKAEALASMGSNLLASKPPVDPKASFKFHAEQLLKIAKEVGLNEKNTRAWINTLEAFSSRHDLKTENLGSLIEQVASVEMPIIPDNHVRENGPNRRSSGLRNIKAENLTRERLIELALTSEVTQLPNIRAYSEATNFDTEHLPIQVAIDADSLKWVNDSFGHDQGTKLLEIIGRVLNEEAPGRAYHFSGDEFALQCDTQEEAAIILDRAIKSLSEATITNIGADGTTKELKGLRITYGIAETLIEADEILAKQKIKRAEAGLRALRGEEPPQLVVQPLAQGELFRQAVAPETSFNFHADKILQAAVAAGLDADRTQEWLDTLDAFSTRHDLDGDQVNSLVSQLDAAAKPIPSAKGFDFQAKVDSQEQQERRVFDTRNILAKDMTTEQLVHLVKTSEVTQMPNRRAYSEDTEFDTILLPIQVAIDADSLKWINDAFGHHQGTKMLEIIGQVLKEEGKGRAYHFSGDEFALQCESIEKAEAILNRVVERLDDVVLSHTTPDGERMELQGLRVTYGIAESLKAADEILAQEKIKKTEMGLRAPRGEAPPQLVIQPLIKNDHRGSLVLSPQEHLALLFGSSSESELIQKTANLFLEETDSLIESGLAADGLSAGWVEVSQWLALKSGQPVTVAQQNKFAASFTASLDKGSSFDPKVQSTFDRFSGWLISSYNHIQERSEPVSDEAKRFLSRLLTVSTGVEPDQAAAAKHLGDGHQFSRAQAGKSFDKYLIALKAGVYHLITQEGEVRVATEFIAASLNRLASEGNLISVPLSVTKEEEPEALEEDLQLDLPQDQPEPDSENYRIEDTGEVIWGARKHLVDDSPIPKVKQEKDTTPAWQKRYLAMQIVNDRDPANIGKWQLLDTKTNRPVRSKSGSYSFNAMLFDSAAAAESIIPLAEVARNHIVSSRGTEDHPDFQICRRLSNGNRPPVKTGFATAEEAQFYLAKNAVEIIETRFQFPEKPWLDHIVRIGEDVRTGNISPEKFAAEFRFRGVQFGNWNMGSDGQAALNYAYDGLHDLAKVLNVTPKTLSLNGDLAVAFGARGHGLSSASAHYEPQWRCFNLTKIKGAGSTAHEWLHALDHYMGVLDGKASLEKNAEGKVTKASAADFLSHGHLRLSNLRPEVLNAYKILLKTLTSKQVQKAPDIDVRQKQLANSFEGVNRTLMDLRRSLNNSYSKRPATDAQLKEWDRMAKELVENPGEAIGIKSPQARKFSFPRSSFQGIEDLNVLYKKCTGYSFATKQEHSRGRLLYSQISGAIQAQTQLERANEGQKDTYATPTDFHRSAREIDNSRASGYWAELHEELARAFEAYVTDKLAVDEGRSDYLVYGADNRFYRLLGMKPFPEGEERQVFNQAFDAFFETINGHELEARDIDLEDLDENMEKSEELVASPSF